MAQELTVNVSLAYQDTELADLILQKLAARVSVGTKKYTQIKQNIGTSEEALILGEVTSLGYACFINRDATNFVEIRVGTGGAKIVKLLAGEAALFRFGSGVTAPYAIADTGAVQLEYLIVSN